MVGKAQELKSGDGYTNVRSRALSSCAICTEHTFSIQSILNALHLIQIAVSGKSFLSTNRQLFVDFYLQTLLTKQRLVWYNPIIREETNRAVFYSSLLD